MNKLEPTGNVMKAFYHMLSCDKCKTKVLQADDYFNLANKLKEEIDQHIRKGHKDE